MADPLSVLAAIAVGIAALSYILWYYHADKKRSAGMRVVANELGMDFVRLGYTNLRMQMQMNNFQHRSLKNGQMKNLIFGKTETASIAVFDCRNTSNGGKNEHTQTVVMIELKGNDQPAIRDFFDTEIRSFCANRPDLYRTFRRLGLRFVGNFWPALSDHWASFLL